MMLKILKNKFILMACLLSGSLMAAEADRKQPVEIEADSASFVQENKRTEFSGNVIVHQGSLKITAANVIAERNDKDEQFITATGNPVRFQQNLDEKRSDGTPQLVKGHANKVVFDHAKSTVTLSGNAVIDREGDTVSGSSISYNTKTSVYSVKGSGGKKGRVSVVLQPSTVGGK
ncbi:MAG: lipopolysaccharide transport periplasmic protein LptA [Neisseriaceae bacterium]|nr:lipopolysaccharide transport periplasmic protein LptA [Neisseriaceae bacterium]